MESISHSLAAASTGTVAVQPPSTPSRKPAIHDGLIDLWIQRLFYHYINLYGVAGVPEFTAPSSKNRRHRPDPMPRRQGDEDIIGLICFISDIEKPPETMPKLALRKYIQTKMKTKISKLEKKLQGTPWLETINPHASQSLHSIAQLLDLKEAELKCLALVLMLHTHENLRTAASILGPSLNDQETLRAIAAMLNLPLEIPQEALAPKSRLMSSQLIRWDHQTTGFSNKFEWLEHKFPQEMLNPGFDPVFALRPRIAIAPDCTLAWEKFSTLGELREIALAYLTISLQQNKAGINVLLYGSPGCGKSEFSRALARQLQCTLYEVTAEDADGDPVDGGRRLQALRVLYSLCASRRSMVVFDEIEDCFPKPHPLFGSSGGRYKGWINKILENNPVATIWITNSVESLDPAFVRRLDLVLEFKGPSPAARETQLRNLQIALPESTIKAISACPTLAPAVVSRAANVAQSVALQRGDNTGAKVMELVVNETLKAQGHSKINPVGPISALYDAAYINADFDPVAMVEGIRSARAARLCLFGPPGTGKTAYGVWLAGQLGRPLLIKRASDILSQYVGMAEKNIAAAFREATAMEAVLLLDEVDSFLQDRSRAQRPWEVTQVNEFLTQLEMYSGVFIATTNLMDGLDSASLRRFDLKGKFNYLKPDQAVALWLNHLQAVGIEARTSPDEARLRSLTNLTPGDFATVARQARFNPLREAKDWVAALTAECDRKPSAHRTIMGFSA